jgi:hypothetical protein
MQPDQLLGALLLLAIVIFVAWRLKKRPNRDLPVVSSGEKRQGARPSASVTNDRVEVPQVRPDAGFEMDKKCPYCHVEMPADRKVKSKCPSCQKSLKVRSKHGLFPRSMFTDVEARAVDGLVRNGATPAEFETMRQPLARSYGFEPALPDVLYGLMNARVSTLRDPHELKMHYFQMALILHGEGKDPRRMRQESAKWGLKQWKAMAKSGALRSMRLTVITCREDSWEACRALEGRTFSLEELLASPPLPVQNCTHDENAGGFGWCRCDYGLTE